MECSNKYSSLNDLRSTHFIITTEGSHILKKYLFGLGFSLVLAQGAIAHSVAQPTACIISKFTAVGDPYWKSVTLTLTNNCTKIVDFQNTTVTFKSTTAINADYWGEFSPLPYPDNVLRITSQNQPDNNFLATLNLHFPSYPGSSTKLPVGSSIKIKYGVPADNHIAGTTNVYLQTAVDTGTVVLHNESNKPTNVTQNYALVNLSINGQVSTVQLPWASTTVMSESALGSYSLTADTVSDSNDNHYQGSVNPNSFTLSAGQTIHTSINYAVVDQLGKLIINLQALPTELAGYANSPAVLVSQAQTGSAINQPLEWNNATTVSQLKEGSSYTFSTNAISYNGYQCSPSFNPASLVASASTAPTTNLTYQCTQINQHSVTFNVTGAPANLVSLRVTLIPNDNSASVVQIIDLNNGAGSNTISLTQDVIYTVSAETVSGYSITFSPQPLTVTANAIETISLSPENAGTPVSINGQLTVCGTKLCNAQGNPIQLKGMSTHGLQWYGQGKCITSQSLDFLVNNLKANVIRLSLYVQEGGYETNPTKFTQEVSTLINEAYNRGIYVIVDWHMLDPGDPNYNLARAKQFFTAIATAHNSKNNILYEIANEPNGVSWATIKSYADQIIPVIRAIDAKAPIIVGTRAWSSLGVSDGQTYQEIVNNPVQFPNIMYTFHFYAASHRDNYLNALNNASQVLPIFVTEFGTQTFTGDGANDFAMSDRYMQLMANQKIGWTNWNYSDDFRSGAIWKTNTCSSGAWAESSLKESGVYIKNKIQTPTP